MVKIKALIFQLLILTVWDAAMAQAVNEKEATPKITSVYVIPVEGQISKAQLYVLRRGLKQAIQENADTVLLSMDTPGGDLATTLEMMEMLDKFNGTTITYVNDEAISAGAYITVATDLIYFSPNGLIGAAAVIQGTGADVPETAQLKINSYLRAKVRSLTGSYRYRSDVLRAMMDKDFEFTIGETVLKQKGELLTLTAQEAIKLYGEPPEALLGSGIFPNITSLLDYLYGNDHYVQKDFVTSWSEELAKWLNKITPLLLGLGLLFLFIEFKTPGFGVFGVTGVILVILVFLSSYVAGLAGYEPILFFALALVLIGIEIFVFPGTVISGLLGMMLLIGSILWALADIWPTKDFKFSLDLFISPVMDLAIGVLIAVTGSYIIGRFFLKKWVRSSLILNQSVTNMQRKNTVATTLKEGDIGIVTKTLRPSGEIEVHGKRYEAHVKFGVVEAKSKVEVCEIRSLSILVREIKT
ncbi:MAG: hypothetical protein COZ46_00245 [Verrucomicrobia bacterium CG_4_10_14_3_um_filter_43_23]|nr:MAG: hypothetical protein AUJ82_04695 [Verrucomicrobia bacterium CG1_02_43_26]PIP59008.1 MAG: hypothetical protein COX01_05510 [Verrucomicrobia bacterium CG22_combo_CG10-13_8_21_14_all_43_17]PIX59106.1 MAG: hypothetical protein COZ46_00245 [Verrucomicrobia bacterium CG_4_10_14_3_um_filter_43_23]PIY61372.1 MAG: hypothetical protein COY94_05865 [Verrucomicrobia bacterium CG_4_10_14_0_8_um_filter_43_34]PJA44154.1 MAG: hypothetical protein CO175_04580 [Verrucomicrobia bacterium CG_4_9_14_3_um_fi